MDTYKKVFEKYQKKHQTTGNPSQNSNHNARNIKEMKSTIRCNDQSFSVKSLPSDNDIYENDLEDSICTISNYSGSSDNEETKPTATLEYINPNKYELKKTLKRNADKEKSNKLIKKGKKIVENDTWYLGDEKDYKEPFKDGSEIVDFSGEEFEYDDIEPTNACKSSENNENTKIIEKQEENIKNEPESYEKSSENSDSDNESDFEDSQENLDLTNPKEINAEGLPLVYTQILSEFKDLNPKVSEIARHEATKRYIYLISLDDGQKYILKRIEVNVKTRPHVLDKIYKEFFIGKAFMSFTGSVAETKNIMQIKKGDIIYCEILIEYGGIDLNELFTKGKVKTFKELCTIIYQMTRVLELSESIGIANFDVKPENFVWDKKGKQLKIIDFGESLSFFHKPNELMANLNYRRLSGITPLFAAPEVCDVFDQINNKGSVNESELKIIPNKADVYSYGLTLLFMLMKFFKSEIKHSDLFDKYKDLIKFVKNKSNSYLDKCRDLLLKCLNKNPESRPTFSDIAKIIENLIKSQMETNDVKEILKNLDNSINHFEVGEAFKNIHQYDIAALHYEKYIQKRFLKEKKLSSYDIERISKIIIFHIKNKTSESVVALSNIIKSYVHKVNYDYEEIKDLYEIITKKTGFEERYYVVYIYFWDQVIQHSGEMMGSNNLIEIYFRITDISIGIKAIEFTNEKLDKNQNTLTAISFEKAVRYCIEMVEITKKAYGECNESIISQYENLACLYAKKNYDNAKKYANLATEMKEIIYGRTHPDIAFAYEHLTMQYAKENNFYNALECAKIALEIQEKHVGKIKHNLHEIYTNLSVEFEIHENYDHAIYCINLALEIMKNTIGDVNSEANNLYSRLEKLYKKLKNYAKAMECLEKEMFIEQKIFGPTHPNIALIFNRFAILYIHNGQIENAIKSCESAVQIIKKISGKLEISFIESYEKLAKVFSKLKIVDYAFKYCDLIIDVKIKANECTPSIAFNQYKVILNYLNMKQDNSKYISSLYKIIEKYKDKIIDKNAEKPYPIELKYLYELYMLLAEALTCSDSPSESIRYYKKAKKVLKKVNKLTDDYTIAIARGMASAYEILKKYDKAIIKVKFLIKYMKKHHIGGNNTSEEYNDEIVKLYDLLAKLYAKSGQNILAIDACNQSAGIRKRQLGGTHEKVIESYISLAFLYRKLNQHHASINCFNQIIKIKENLHAANNIIFAYLNMAKEYGKLNELSKAINIVHEAIEYCKAQDLHFSDNIAKAYIILAKLYARTRQHYMAFDYCYRAGEIYAKEMSKVLIALPFEKLGLKYLRIGLFYYATDCFDEAYNIGIRENVRGANKNVYIKNSDIDY